MLTKCFLKKKIQKKSLVLVISISFISTVKTESPRMRSHIFSRLQWSNDNTSDKGVFLRHKSLFGKVENCLAKKRTGMTEKPETG